MHIAPSRPLSRRALVKGAAWAVPAVAVAVAAPQAAASLHACVNTPLLGAWVDSLSESSFNSKNDTGSGWGTHNGWISGVFNVVEDSKSGETPTVSSSAALTNLTPGATVTFDFNFSAFVKLASRHTVIVFAEVLVAGAPVQQWSVNTSTYTTAGLHSPLASSLSYTVPGLVPANVALRYRVVYSAGGSQSDDVRLSAPTIACTTGTP